jgi:hypothetical protein
LLLRDFEFADVEGAGNLGFETGPGCLLGRLHASFVLGLGHIALKAGNGTGWLELAHDETAGRDKNQFHADAVGLSLGLREQQARQN